MHFNRLDLNLLVALDALLTEQNITRASERVHLSQSAMSGALARLREYFGDELLVQVGRRMVPTPLGESLAAPVREVLLKVETTIQARPEFDPATSCRNFRLLMSDYVSTVLMAPALPRLQQLAPQVTFELLPYFESQWESLDRGEIDFLIMPTEYLRDGHPAETLFEDSYTCVVWAGNPLVGDAITLDQYLELGHIVVRFGQQRVPAFDEWFFNRFDRTRRIEIIATTFNAIPQLIIGTTRIATVHKRLAAFYARFLPLKFVAPPIEMPTLTEAIVWHKYRDPDPGNTWVRHMLKEAAGRAGPALDSLAGGEILPDHASILPPNSL